MRQPTDTASDGTIVATMVNHLKTAAELDRKVAVYVCGLVTTKSEIPCILYIYQAQNQAYIYYLPIAK